MRPTRDGPWTQFMDMHSGGPQKLEWEKIYIDLPRQEAIEYFIEEFDRHPFNITCRCCGEDYSIVEFDDLEAATSHERGKSHRDFNSIRGMVEHDDFKIIETREDDSQ